MDATKDGTGNKATRGKVTCDPQGIEAITTIHYPDRPPAGGQLRDYGESDRESPGPVKRH
jgi:hypothetical protein